MTARPAIESRTQPRGPTSGVLFAGHLAYLAAITGDSQ